MDILLVEDSYVDAQAIRDALEATPSPMAITHLEDLSDIPQNSELSPDVVLLDLSLGETEGVATVAKARACLPDPPIVILTADKSEEQAYEALRAGAQDYLVKGEYSADMLLRSIRYSIERHSLKRGLMRADRLAAVGQLAAGVAHEVSNPASFVLGNATSVQTHLEAMLGLLRELGPKADSKPARELESRIAQVKELTDETLGGVERIAKVIRELQDYSRLGERRITRVDINAIVQESSKLVRNSLRHRAKLILSLGDINPILADGSKLEQVFTNLLVNASHAIEEGNPRTNQVRITTKAERRGEKDERIIVTVEDNGCGIESDNVEHIFKPFFTTKPREKGTGLGLSVVAEIVHLHGGTVDCDSQLGDGTRFTINLPLHNGLAAQRKPRPSANLVRPVSPGRILVIDDEPLVRRLLQQILATQHEAVTVGSGEEALALLSKDPNFDAVVCDFTMPGMDGPTLYEAIKKQLPRLANSFIFCTGGALTQSARKATETQDLVVLYKPIRADDLLAAVNTQLSLNS